MTDHRSRMHGSRRKQLRAWVRAVVVALAIIGVSVATFASLVRSAQGR